MLTAIKLKALIAEAEANRDQYYGQAARGFEPARSYGAYWARVAADYRGTLATMGGDNA